MLEMNCDGISCFFSWSLPAEKQSSFARQHLVPPEIVPLPSRSVPDFSRREESDFSKMLAMFFYSTDTPFDCIENSYLRAAIKICRPNVFIPSKKDLEGELLNDMYTKCVELTQGQNVEDNITTCSRKEIPDIKAKLDFIRKHKDLIAQDFKISCSSKAERSNSGPIDNKISQDKEDVHNLITLTTSV